MRRVFGPEGLFERDAQRLGHSLAVCRVGIVAVARVALLDEQLGKTFAEELVKKDKLKKLLKNRKREG